MDGGSERKGKVLLFQTADELALLGAAARLYELQVELAELKSFVRQAQSELPQSVTGPRKDDWRSTARVHVGLSGH